MNPNIFQPIQVPGDDEIREILVRRIDQQKQAVGIVVGVIEPDGRRVVAYGNLAHGDPRTLDGDTIFEIGSVTKVFTSLLLADMVKRQEVTLDDPAAKYLPENVKMPERNGKSITLHDLATHSSGLPRLPSNLKPKDPRNPYADYSVDDMYQFLSGYELPRDPDSDLKGSEFEYSNLGGGLLGHVLAYRAGTDYESLIRTRITRPLGMPDTGITLSSSMQQRMATGHDPRLVPAANWDLPTLAGAGALRSSANDMLTFLEAFLGYKVSPLAPPMKAMFEVRRTLGKANVGLGWFIFSTDTREIANHDGGTGGFCSYLGYDPKERIGVVVLSNAFAPAGVVDIGLHLLNPKLPLANIESPKQHTEIQIDPKLLDNYTGRYQLTPNLVFEITRDGDRLFAQGFGQVNGQAMALPKFELFAEGEKNFFARVADNQITFETGPDGRATSLIMHRAGRDMRAARLS
ncbi:MAG TPA: serine hydrolase [Bryobacteraceae bacterium]|jgi:CubicO group peptidase (beta-lactamase class C family)|nr:serine hydrolase [Bryobacteraceae bacterium]